MHSIWYQQVGYSHSSVGNDLLSVGFYDIKKEEKSVLFSYPLDVSWSSQREKGPKKVMKDEAAIFSVS